MDTKYPVFNIISRDHPRTLATVKHFLGIDFGTSGCRSCVIDANASIKVQIRTPLPAPSRRNQAVEQDPEIW